MPDNQKKIIPIDYTHREFESIREDLIPLYLSFFEPLFNKSEVFIIQDFQVLYSDLLILILDSFLHEFPHLKIHQVYEE